MNFQSQPLRHRQTKGAATDMLSLTPPRHTPTLRIPVVHRVVYAQREFTRAALRVELDIDHLNG